MIIVGAGGYFLELYEYIQNDINQGHLNNLIVKGVLDDKKPVDTCGLPYLGPIGGYNIGADDIFILAIGNTLHRKVIFENLKTKGASFFTFIHSSALVSPSAELGDGVIVCPFSIVNAKAKVGHNVSVNVNVSVGHEAVVGDHCVLSPYSALNGAASLEHGGFLGTRATIFPRISVDAQCTIDSHTAVRRNIAAKQIVTEKVSLVSVTNRFLR